MTNMTDGSVLVKRAEKCFNSPERKNFESLWDLSLEFQAPRQYSSYGSSMVKGEKKTRRVFDGTAIRANRDLAATIHSTLTNPATQWSKIRFTDEEKNNNPELIKYLEKATKALHLAFNESNFDTEIAKFYQHFAVAGTAVLFHEEKPTKKGGVHGGFIFRTIHLSEIAFSENAEGRIDTSYRKFPLTARQAVSRFGIDNVPDSIKEIMLTDPDKSFDFYHIIYPRSEYEPNTTGLADGKNRPFASVYIEAKSKMITEEDGYYEFPIYAVRWETLAGEIYGRGPGFDALPDVRTLNTLVEQNLQQRALALRPPLLASTRTVMGNLDLRPGAINVVKNVDDVREMVTAARFDVSNDERMRLEAAIKETYYLDKLFLPPRETIGEMTAFEASKRIEQMQRVIGPTIARISTELLQPLVLRAFAILLRGGALPQAPAELAGQELDIEVTFLNQLARAQQFEDVTNIQSYAQQLGLLMQLDPTAADWIDVGAAAKKIGQTMGVPEAVISNDDEVKARQQARGQQAQMAQALEAGVAVADIASKTAGSSTGGK